MITDRMQNKFLGEILINVVLLNDNDCIYHHVLPFCRSDIPVFDCEFLVGQFGLDSGPYVLGCFGCCSIPELSLIIIIFSEFTEATNVTFVGYRCMPYNTYVLIVL